MFASGRQFLIQVEKWEVRQGREVSRKRCIITLVTTVGKWGTLGASVKHSTQRMMVFIHHLPSMIV